MRQRITTLSCINGQPVRADNSHPIVANIVEGIQEHMAYMRKRHSRVLYASCVLKYPAGRVSDNPTGDISSAMRKLHQKAKRENIELLTTWTMEKDTSKTPHANVIFLADGTKTQSGFRPLSWMKAIWARQVGVKPEHSPVHLNLNNPKFFPPAAEIGIKPAHQLMIRKGSPEEQIMADNIINAASYYAKTLTKESIPGRTYGRSRIPPTNNE